MRTNDEILAILRDIMAELFEVSPDDVLPEARLDEDLDIDSIDAVDMMVKLKEITGKKIDPERFKKVRTVSDVVAAVSELLNNQHA